MLFSSLLFLFLFLPVFLVVYTCTKPSARNLVLLVGSFLFYAWGEQDLIPVLLFSLALNYFLALLLHGLQGKKELPVEGWKSKVVITIALAGNLLPLIYFKYANFLVGLIPETTNSFLEFKQSWVEVALPIGISFYTFQAMSYTIDVYRGTVKPARSFIDFACYVTSFPQLIAGPIVRYKDLAPQLLHRRMTFDKTASGIKLFIIGLAKKMIVANTVAIPADYLFGLPVEQLDVAGAWVGAVCYTLQIYYDFSGYTDMAIGLGLMLGFKFPKNFNYPYAAKSIADFWKRWHISLSTWFRDYVYIPLGGNRRSTFRTYFNLWVVFLVCGLWHGAKWTFIVWGAYYGFFLVLERAGLGEKLKGLPCFFRRCYTIMIVIFGWVIFRSDDLSHAWGFLESMWGIDKDFIGLPAYQVNILPTDVLIALATGIIFSVPLRKLHIPVPIYLTYAFSFMIYFCLFFLSVVLLVSDTHNPFLYFRF